MESLFVVPSPVVPLRAKFFSSKNRMSATIVVSCEAVIEGEERSQVAVDDIVRQSISGLLL